MKKDGLATIPPYSFDSIVFDLDGTLWDTCETCALAWNNVVKRNDIQFRTITAKDVQGVTGMPHEDCIRTVFSGLSEEKLHALIDGTMTEDNKMVAELGGHLFEGVFTGLQRLADRYSLFIVSNCQSGYIELFMEKARAQPFFRDHECWGNTGRSKGENLKSLIDRNRLKSPLMVGDTDGDEKAAIHCGVPFWFVTYGFGRSDRCQKSFASFNELVQCLL